MTRQENTGSEPYGDRGGPERVRFRRGPRGREPIRAAQGARRLSGPPEAWGEGGSMEDDAPVIYGLEFQVGPRGPRRPVCGAGPARSPPPCQPRVRRLRGPRSWSSGDRPGSATAPPPPSSSSATRALPGTCACGSRAPEAGAVAAPVVQF